MKRVLFFISLCISFCISISTAYAFTVRTGDDLVVSSDEVVLEDLFIAGDTVIIEGSIQGDLYAAARTVVISGSVRDSATIFAATSDITGSVGRGIPDDGMGQELLCGGSAGVSGRGRQLYLPSLRHSFDGRTLLHPPGFGHFVSRSGGEYRSKPYAAPSVCHRGSSLWLAGRRGGLRASSGSVASFGGHTLLKKNGWESRE